MLNEMKLCKKPFEQIKQGTKNIYMIYRYKKGK